MLARFAPAAALAAWLAGLATPAAALTYELWNPPGSTFGPTGRLDYDPVSGVLGAASVTMDGVACARTLAGSDGQTVFLAPEGLADCVGAPVLSLYLPETLGTQGRRLLYEADDAVRCASADCGARIGPSAGTPPPVEARGFIQGPELADAPGRLWRIVEPEPEPGAISISLPSGGFFYDGASLTVSDVDVLGGLRASSPQRFDDAAAPADPEAIVLRGEGAARDEALVPGLSSPLSNAGGSGEIDWIQPGRCSDDCALVLTGSDTRVFLYGVRLEAAPPAEASVPLPSAVLLMPSALAATAIGRRRRA